MWLGSNRQKQRKTSQASQKMDKILLSRYFCCLLCLASQPSHRVTLLPKSEGGMLRETDGCERAYFYRCNVYKMAMNKYNVLIIIRLRYRMKAKKSLFTSFITRESIASLSKTVAILTLMSFNCTISR